MNIIEDKLTHPQVIELLRYHVRDMLDVSPPGTSFALDLDALLKPDITFWSLWDNERIAGCVALKELAPYWGEIKSMRAHSDFVRKGVGRALLKHIFTVSKNRRCTRLSLETGTGPSFYAAIELYAQNGFKLGDVFADYVESPFNIFMHKSL